MNLRPRQLLNQVRMGEAVDRNVIHELSNSTPLNDLIDVAGALRDEGHGGVVSYSRKIFIPLTHLCRDVCHYCTFAKPPHKGEQVYMSRDQVLAVARAGAEAGCKEALFTLGDKPEIRYTAARHALEGLGQLVENVDRVKAHLNPDLEVSTIALVMYDARTKLSEQVAGEVRAVFGSKVCRQVIPRSVGLSEASSYGQPINVYDPRSRGAVAYRELAREILHGPVPSGENTSMDDEINGVESGPEEVWT